MEAIVVLIFLVCFALIIVIVIMAKRIAYLSAESYLVSQFMRVERSVPNIIPAASYSPKIFRDIVFKWKLEVCRYYKEWLEQIRDIVLFRDHLRSLDGIEYPDNRAVVLDVMGIAVKNLESGRVAFLYSEIIKIIRIESGLVFNQSVNIQAKRFLVRNFAKAGPQKIADFLKELGNLCSKDTDLASAVLGDEDIKSLYKKD